MTEKHMPGRLIAKGDNIKQGRHIIASNISAGPDAGNILQSVERREANAARMAACWNACDGVSTADLMAGPGYLAMREKQAQSMTRINELKALLASVCENTAITGTVPADVMARVQAAVYGPSPQTQPPAPAPPIHQCEWADILMEEGGGSKCTICGHRLPF